MKRMFAMLLVLMILFTGCVSDNKNTKETEAASDTSVSVSDSDALTASDDDAAAASDGDALPEEGLDIDRGEAED